MLGFKEVLPMLPEGVVAIVEAYYARQRELDLKDVFELNGSKLKYNYTKLGDAIKSMRESCMADEIPPQFFMRYIHTFATTQFTYMTGYMHGGERHSFTCTLILTKNLTETIKTAGKSELPKLSEQPEQPKLDLSEQILSIHSLLFRLELVRSVKEIRETDEMAKKEGTDQQKESHHSVILLPEQVKEVTSVIKRGRR